jgi:hypothetical protein
VPARHPDPDESLAQIVQVSPPEWFGEFRMTPPVGGQVVVLGDDDCKLLTPCAASGSPQPRVHGAYRGHEIIQGREHVDVMKSRGYGQLVIAVVLVGYQRAGHVKDPVYVAAVAGPAMLVAARMVSMFVQDSSISG